MINKMSNYDVLVICSGGVDSTTALYRAVAMKLKVMAITFNFPGRAIQEKTSVSFHTKELGVPLMHFDISPLLACELNGIKQKPCRNLVFISIAANIACAKGITEIHTGISEVDVNYLDCHLNSVLTFEKAVDSLTNNQVTLITPFLFASKADIVAEGLKLGVPYEKTWSCYNQEMRHCGVCLSCRQRINAFSENRITEPAIVLPMWKPGKVEDYHELP